MISNTQKFILALIVLTLPTRVAAPVVNLFGWKISPRAKIGISWFFCDFVGIDESATIGHFNLFIAQRILIRKNGVIGRMNIVSGPLRLFLAQAAAIGNRNRILRAQKGVVYGYATLSIGINSKITSDHTIDCTRSVKIGSNSIIAGYATQIWTHGYIHELSGSGRYRIDGEVDIGANVYIGSSCFISLGVTIKPGIIVGGGTSISKNLDEPGMYVSAPIRMLPRPARPDQRIDLIKVDSSNLVEIVYKKIK